VPVGWDIKRRAGKKKVVLELGGKPPSSSTVTPTSPTPPTDALPEALPRRQTCISVQRIFVEHSVYGRFTDLIVEGVKKLKVGDPLDESTDVGPLIRESERHPHHYLDRRRGPRRSTSSVRRRTQQTHRRADCSYRYQARHESELSGNFGPSSTIEPYKDFDQAIRQVNNSVYGMQAGVFTRDAKLLFQAYEDLEVGGMIAGDVPSFRIDHNALRWRQRLRPWPRRPALRHRRNDRTQTLSDELR